jgi:crossover junction endodeoxyribonuclease RuvC
LTRQQQPDDILVLGIDPGLRTTGYGLVRERGGVLKAVEFGALRSTAKRPLTERLYEITSMLAEILQQYQPHCASVELVFAAANMKTALLLGHVRGAILNELRRSSTPVHEYSALEIKRATVGYGRAEKGQVAEMCRVLLGLREMPTPPDAADALAAAICHLHARRQAHVLEGGTR